MNYVKKQKKSVRDHETPHNNIFYFVCGWPAILNQTKYVNYNYDTVWISNKHLFNV